MLHITDWGVLYENASTRKYVRLNAVLVPNKFDGSKYAEIITGENGIQRHAAWVTILAVASRNGGSGTRGYVQRSDGRPHTAASLSLITRIPQAVYDDAIPGLVELGWLEDVASPNGQQAAKPEPAAPATVDGKLCPGCDQPGGTERDPTTGNVWHKYCCYSGESDDQSHNPSQAATDRGCRWR